MVVATTPTKVMAANELVHHQGLMKDNGGIIQSPIGIVFLLHRLQRTTMEQHRQLLNGPTPTTTSWCGSTTTTEALIDKLSWLDQTL